MSTPNPITGQHLLDLHRTLGIMHLNDPVLAIQNAMSWLCPHVAVGDDAWNWSNDEMQTEIVCAMLTCRTLWPPLYQAAFEAVNQQTVFDQKALESIYWLLVNGISLEIGPHMEIWELSQMAYGVPVVGFGCDIFDDEFMHDEDDLAGLLADLGIDLDWNYEAMKIKYKVVNDLQISLLGSKPQLPAGDPTPRQALGWLLAWMFASTGNFLSDTSPDSVMQGGWERIPWTGADIDFMRNEHEMAYCIYQTAQLGHDLLLHRPEWREALLKNWKRIERLLKNDTTPTRKSCRWPRDSRVVRRGKTSPGS